MPEILDRSRARLGAARTGDDPRPLAATSALAAGWSAGAGLVLCTCVALVGWIAGSTGTAADAVRVGAQAWLLGQGSGLRVGSASVTAVPLGLTTLSAALLWRAGTWAASAARAADLRAVCSGTAIVAAVFATVATSAALLSGTGSVAVSPLRAFGSSLLLAGVFSGLGMLRGAGLLDVAWRRLPEYARAALRGAGAAVLAMFATGALLVTVALAADFGRAANVAHAMGAGVVGGAILTLVGVLLLPNAALFAVSYLLGPGFVFGAGTAVTPDGVSLGRVPAFPLLAALPAEALDPWQAAGLLAVPVLAGVLAAVVALRHHPVTGLVQAALRSALAGLLAGLATGGLTALAGGAIGPGRMGETGAEVLLCAATAALAMTLGGAVGGMLLGWRLRGRSRAAG